MSFRDAAKLLHHRHRGACQRCGCWTIRIALWSKLRRAGWQYLYREHLFVSPAGWCYSQATVQHVLARSLGGASNLSNLTLYCWHCNQADNVEITARLSQSDEVRSIVDTMRREGRLRRDELLRWADDGGPQPEGRMSGGAMREYAVPRAEVWKRIQSGESAA